MAVALEQPNIWADPKRAQDLGREKKALDDVVDRMRRLDHDLGDAAELFELSRADQDGAALATIDAD
ncbi:MAG TPA: PCRF domain-containing protein, partial [Burkholderiaceae bacterium]|nr:PCRF domain-containing protein [Burkholderiaceae bacterium]